MKYKILKKIDRYYNKKERTGLVVIKKGVGSLNFDKSVYTIKLNLLNHDHLKSRKEMNEIFGELKRILEKYYIIKTERKVKKE